MRIVICDSFFETVKALTELIQSLLLSTKREKFYLAISGGETPLKLFNYWCAMPQELPWERIEFFWVDERCVEPFVEESNYHQARVHLFTKLGINPKQVHRIRGEADPSSEAARYSALVENLLPEMEGQPRFDLVLLGVGADGHTASLFPGISFDAPDSPHAIYQIAQKPATEQYRVTMGLPVINNAACVCFLACGAEKRTILSDIFKKKECAQHYPAYHVKPHHGSLFYFTDRSATIDSCFSEK